MANSKIEQQVADTTELMSLIAESTIETGENLNKVDRTVTAVGKTVVGVHKTAKEVLKSVEEQTEVVNVVRDNQEKVQDTNKELTKTVNETLTAFHTNTEVLTQISDSIKAKDVDEQNRHETLVKEIQNDNSKYAEKVGDLIAILNDNKEEIKKLDVHKEVAELVAQLISVQENMDTTREFISKSDAAVDTRIGRLEDVMVRAVDVIENSNTQFADINSVLETAISRLQTIELKLDTNDEQEVDTAIVDLHSIENEDVFDEDVQEDVLVDDDADVEDVEDSEDQKENEGE